jgi:HrpA-like RNA helicase
MRDQALEKNERQRVQEFAEPELKRAPLSELCLQAKRVAPSVPLAAFLSRAIDAPDADAIAADIALLRSLGALDAAEAVTPLGRVLAALPLEPRFGKLLLYGLLYGCFEPILTLACLFSYQCVLHRICAQLLLNRDGFGWSAHCLVPHAAQLRRSNAQRCASALTAPCLQGALGRPDARQRARGNQAREGAPCAPRRPPCVRPPHPAAALQRVGGVARARTRSFRAAPLCVARGALHD